MKEKLLLNRGRIGISTVAIVVIVVVIIAIAGIGAYLAVSLPKTSSTTTSTTTTASCVSTFSTYTSSSGYVLPCSSVLSANTLAETGSSLLYPLFNLWVGNFTGVFTNLKITTAATGSGTGQSDAEHGLVQVGGSDAYLTNTQAGEYPYILNIPLAISAQQIDYNIPGISSSVHLNFSGPVLAQIYNGSITCWCASQITSINPGAASILSAISPSDTIVPIHRADSSGDTFIFTSYLSDTNSWWNSSIGYGTTVSWPSVPAAITGTGNSGMVSECQITSYSIAYIGVSYLNAAVKLGLGYAYLQNRAGNFVNITLADIQAAASQFASSTPSNERISLIDANGTNSYPIVNYEYAMVAKNQTSTGIAQDLQTFLTWAVEPNYGNSAHFLNQVNFVPLPSSIVELSLDQINQITG